MVLIKKTVGFSPVVIKKNKIQPGIKYQIGLSSNKKDWDKSYDLVASDGTKFEIISDPRNYFSPKG